MKQINCQIASPGTTDKVNRLLNDAWIKFWENPMKFAEWEKQAVKNFKDQYPKYCQVVEG
ncbi:MAG TPA: hypothetical protein VL727_19215 [Puia sp.]|jgi:hypothetical protein|nr:hypothetical protein [Puia sp.]